jgi:hypothetical protein
LGFFWHKKSNEKAWEAKMEQQLIYCTKFKMKEFDKHFLQCLLVGAFMKTAFILKILNFLFRNE